MACSGDEFKVCQSQEPQKYLASLYILENPWNGMAIESDQLDLAGDGGIRRQPSDSEFSYVSS